MFSPTWITAHSVSLLLSQHVCRHSYVNKEIWFKLKQVNKHNQPWSHLAVWMHDFVFCSLHLSQESLHVLCKFMSSSCYVHTNELSKSNPSLVRAMFLGSTHSYCMLYALTKEKKGKIACAFVYVCVRVVVRKTLREEQSKIVHPKGSLKISFK